MIRLIHLPLLVGGLLLAPGCGRKAETRLTLRVHQPSLSVEDQAPLITWADWHKASDGTGELRLYFGPPGDRCGNVPQMTGDQWAVTLLVRTGRDGDFRSAPLAWQGVEAMHSANDVGQPWFLPKLHRSDEVRPFHPGGQLQLSRVDLLSGVVNGTVQLEQGSPGTEGPELLRGDFEARLCQTPPPPPPAPESTSAKKKK